MTDILVQILSGISRGMVLFTVAAGLTIIFGTMRIVNFAHGSFYMLAGFTSFSLVRLSNSRDAGFILSIIVAPLAVAAFGALVEALLLKRIAHRPHQYQLILTYAITLIVADGVRYFWGGVPLSVPRPTFLDGGVNIFGSLFPIYSIAVIGLGALTAVGLYVLLQKTKLGKTLRAAAADPETTEALGVDVPRMMTFVFAFGSWLAGLGGALAAPVGAVSLGVDSAIIIESFAVVVIGGAGSVWGALVAALLIGVVQAIGIVIAPTLSIALVYLVLCVVLIFKPQGFFGREPIRSPAATGPLDMNMLPAPHGGNASFVYLVLGISVILLCLLPLVTTESYLFLATDFLVMALFAMSYNLLFGKAGMLSFGHAAFYGLGSYTVALLIQKLSFGLLPALLLAPLVAGFAAFVIGLFSVRLNGMYFAILTMAFGQLVYTVVFSWYSFTGGDNGFSFEVPEFWLSIVNYYYLVVVTVALSIFLLWKLSSSAFGQALSAIRENVERAAFIGLNVRRYQLAAFVIAGAFSGVAGALKAPMLQLAFPYQLHWTQSAEPILMSLAGGINTFFGPVVGAAVFVFLNFSIARLTDYSLFAFGIVVLAIVLLLPQGIMGTLDALWPRWSGRSKSVVERTKDVSPNSAT